MALLLFSPLFSSAYAQVKFVGCLLDGTRFAEADDRNYKVGSGETVSGLDRGIVTMKKGEKALFTLPPELVYGEAGTNGVSPNSYIKFQVELISWIPVIDVSKDGGVIKRVVAKGEQTGKPGDLDEVLVKYVVTLADGTLLARTPEEGVEFYLNDGHLCPALPKAIKTMNRGEMVNLEVQPKCNRYLTGLLLFDFWALSYAASDMQIFNQATAARKEAFAD